MRTKAEMKSDRVPLLSAGVAFFSLLALVPGMAAVVSLYGLVADPAQVQKRVGNLMGAAPKEVRQMVTTQLKSIVSQSGSKVGIGLAIGILAALWSASSGMKHLIEAIDVAYDEGEGRKFLKLRGIAIVMTLGALLFFVIAITVIAILPAALAHLGLGSAARIIVGILRWPLLGLLLVAALAVLYRYAPDRDEPKWSWVSPGAIVATVLWLVGSLLFSLYTANFGKYNQTYGSLGAVVVVMLWLFLTAFVVIAGAELNAEMERQTKADSTKGPSEPMGGRRAEAADTVGPTAEAVKEGAAT